MPRCVVVIKYLIAALIMREGRTVRLYVAGPNMAVMNERAGHMARKYSVNHP